MNILSPRRYTLYARRRGFTMIEVVVMLAIITILSAIVLVNFTGLNEGGTLNRAQRELGLALRRAQNMAATVKQIEVGGTPDVPPAIGVQLSTQAGSNGSYLLFGDLDQNGRFGAGLENIEKPIPFFRNIIVKEFRNETQAVIAIPTLNILFQAPEAVMTFHDDTNGTLINEPTLRVILEAPSGQIREVTIRTSGQISIK